MYFGPEFDRVINVLVALACLGLLTLLVAVPAAAWWLVVHLRLTFV